jgi:tetratricopeptide (TPR) repeat protein
MRKKFIALVLLLFVFDLYAKNKDVDVYFNAGVESYLRNDYYNAVKNFEKALELAPNDTKLQSLLEKVLFEAGRFYYLKQDYKQALYFLNKGGKLYPDNKKIKELIEIISSATNKGYTKEILQQNIEEKSEKTKIYEKPKPKETKLIQPKEEIKPQPPTYYKKEYEEEVEYKDKLDFFISVIDKIFSYYEKEKSAHYSLIVVVAIICVFIVILIISVILIVLRMNKMYFLLGEEQYNKIVKYVETNLDKLEKQIISANNEFKHYVFNNSKFQLQVNNIAQKIEDLYRKIDILSSYEDKKNKFDVDYQRELEKDITSLMQRFPTYEKKYKEISSGTKTPVMLKPTLIERDEELNMLWRRTISAAVSLYKLNPKSAMSKFAEMLDTGNAYSRANIIWALAEISSEETINFMLDLLHKYENDYNVSYNIISALMYVINNKQLPGYLEEKVKRMLTELKEERGWVF